MNNTYANPDALTKFRANLWIDSLTQLDHLLKGKVEYDDDGYVKLLREHAGQISRTEMVRPVMGMSLERYKYYVTEGGELTIQLMSNGRVCAPTVSDGLNLTMFLAGTEVNTGGVLISPTLPIRYPDEEEMKLTRMHNWLNVLVMYLQLESLKWNGNLTGSNKIHTSTTL
jgi:hypothetical protein